MILPPQIPFPCESLWLLTSHWLRYDLYSLAFLYNQLCLKFSSPAILPTPGFPASGNLPNRTPTPWLSCARYQLEPLGHTSLHCFFSSSRVHSAQGGPKKHCGVNAHASPKPPRTHPQSGRQRQHPARTHTTGCDQKVERVKLAFLPGGLSLSPEASGPGIPFPGINSLFSYCSRMVTSVCYQVTVPPAGP